MLLASYNIQYGLGRDEKYDLARVAKEIAHADIIALQEVERFWLRSGMLDEPAEIAARLPDHHWVFGANLDMGRRNGQVDDDIDRRVGEERIDRHGGETECAGASAGGFGAQVGDTADIEDRERSRSFQIGFADVTAADDADADALHALHP